MMVNPRNPGKTKTGGFGVSESLPGVVSSNVTKVPRSIPSRCVANHHNPCFQELHPAKSSDSPGKKKTEVGEPMEVKPSNLC